MFMKKLIPALFISLISTGAFAQSFPPLNGRPVVDAANVIAPADEARLNETLLEYERTTGHQLVVATIPSLEGYDIETYANGYFRHLRLGDRDADDGVLLLHSPSDRELRIEVGYGLEPVLTDADASTIIQNTIIPLFRQDRFAEGLTAGAQQIIAETQMDNAAIADFRQRQEARQAARNAAFWSTAGNVFLTLLGLLAVVLAGFGISWKVTEPARIRKRKEEEEKLRKYREEMWERQRLLQEREKARTANEIARKKKALEEREAMLAAMTPYDREKLLKREAEAKKAADAAASRAAAERRKRDDEDRARRRSEDSSRSSSYYDSSSSSSSSYSSSSSSSFSGGGGDSGGGGSSGSY